MTVERYNKLEKTNLTSGKLCDLARFRILSEKCGNNKKFSYLEAINELDFLRSLIYNQSINYIKKREAIVYLKRILEKNTNSTDSIIPLCGVNHDQLIGLLTKLKKEYSDFGSNSEN